MMTQPKHFFLSLILFIPFFSLQTVQAQDSFYETGKASYYSDKLHGNPTSSGERYDKYSFTAAHKTLPFNTKVRVTRLDNQKSVVVTVNDRGPFKPGRIIDLSRVAAEQIGLIRDGVTDVKVEIVGSTPTNVVINDQPIRNDSRPSVSNDRPVVSQPSRNRPLDQDLSDVPLVDAAGRPIGGNSNIESGDFDGAVFDDNTGSVVEEKEQAPAYMKEVSKYTPRLFQMSAFKAEPQGFGVQVGAFFNYYRLMEALNDFAAKGIQNTMVQNGVKNNQPIFRILVGPFTTRQEAASMRKQLKAKKISGIIIDLATFQ
ncbi:MAG: septal ring lytic transglycosylase RlpA family protein [Bacteroidota bacterium]